MVDDGAESGARGSGTRAVVSDEESFVQQWERRPPSWSARSDKGRVEMVVAELLVNSVVGVDRCGGGGGFGASGVSQAFSG